MKVLMVWSAPSPYRTDFFNHLGRSCDLTVIYERKYSRDRVREWQDSVKALNYREIYLNGINVGNEQGFCPSVIKLLKPSAYDIVEVGGYSTPTGMLAILCLSARKIPFILNADGGIIGDDSALKLFIKRFFISRASLWLSSGGETDKYLVHYGAKPDCVEWYPQSSVLEKDVARAPADGAEKRQLRQLLGISESKIAVSAGQFIHRKGFDVLIKAAAGLGADTGVYIVGGKPTEEYLSLVKQYNATNVHFIGFLTGGALKRYFRAADLFVLPTRYDIWGLVINEAMASGLPVVTTDKCVAGLELVKDGENGYIVPAGDDAGLARKINAVLGDSRLSAEMGRNSLAAISGYTVESMAARHMDIFAAASRESYKKKDGAP